MKFIIMLLTIISFSDLYSGPPKELSLYDQDSILCKEHLNGLKTNKDTTDLQRRLIGLEKEGRVKSVIYTWHKKEITPRKIALSTRYMQQSFIAIQATKK